MAEETVFVIDDQEIVLRMLSRVFSVSGVEAKTFKTGTEALEVLANGEKPDAVLCDCFGAPNGDIKGMNVDKFYGQAGQYLEGVQKYAMTGTPQEATEKFGDLARFGVKKVFSKDNLSDVAKEVMQELEAGQSDGYCGAD
jgi:CheY-like chemotaxis protein